MMDMSKMSYNEKMYRLGKGFDAGLICYDVLTPGEKYMLNNYYSLKSERADGVISDVNSSLYQTEQKLDNIYNNLLSIE